MAKRKTLTGSAVKGLKVFCRWTASSGFVSVSVFVFFSFSTLGIVIHYNVRKGIMEACFQGEWTLDLVI